MFDIFVIFWILITEVSGRLDELHELKKAEGQAVNFIIPPFATCGPEPYHLQNPKRRNVLTVYNSTSAQISPTPYGYRSTVQLASNGSWIFTLHHITEEDSGTYSIDTLKCGVFYTLSLTKDYVGTAYWLGWESWSGCDTPCDNGHQQRERMCSIPQRCLTGIGQEAMVCVTGPECDTTQAAKTTPTLAYWSTWQQWSHCDTACGPGRQTRRRVCSMSTSCSRENGGDFEERACADNQPCQEIGRWERWTAWSVCSATCDTGRQYRRRSCTDDRRQPSNSCHGDSTETTSCVMKSCTETYFWDDWTTWGGCSASCDAGIQVRDRVCIDIYNRLASGRCVGNRREQKSCYISKCAGNTIGVGKVNSGLADNAPPPDDDKSSDSVPMSVMVGSLAGVFIIVLVVVIAILMVRLRKKRHAVRAIIDPTKSGIHHRRRKTIQSVTRERQSAVHIYDEINDEDIYKNKDRKLSDKTDMYKNIDGKLSDKKMSDFSVDNPYSTMPKSASPRHDPGDSTNDDVAYSNTTEQVFLFEGPGTNAQGKSATLPTNQSALVSSLTKLQADEGGYMAPVSSLERSKQRKFTKQNM